MKFWGPIECQKLARQFFFFLELVPRLEFYAAVLKSLKFETATISKLRIRFENKPYHHAENVILFHLSSLSEDFLEQAGIYSGFSLWRIWKLFSFSDGFTRKGLHAVVIQRDSIPNMPFVSRQVCVLNTYLWRNGCKKADICSITYLNMLFTFECKIDYIIRLMTHNALWK